MAEVGMAEMAGGVAALGRLLGALASRAGEVPKYRYASAGALYPVQAYLSVPAGRVAGLAAGCWYYDPREHALVLVSEAVLGAPPDCAFLLLLVARHAAIVPVYGAVAGEFCVLEAGYMQEALAREAAACGIVLRDAGDPAGWEGLRAALALDAGDVPVACWAGAAA